MTAPIATFRLTRNIAASQDRLWHLLTDAKSREIWGGPSDDVVLVLDTTDLREGRNVSTTLRQWPLEFRLGFLRLVLVD